MYICTACKNCTPQDCNRDYRTAKQDIVSQRAAHLCIYVSCLLLLGHVGKQLLISIADEDTGRLGGGVKQHAEVAPLPLRNHLLRLFVHAHECAVHPHPCIPLPHLQIPRLLSAQTLMCVCCMYEGLRRPWAGTGCKPAAAPGTIMNKTLCRARVTCLSHTEPIHCIHMSGTDKIRFSVIMHQHMMQTDLVQCPVVDPSSPQDVEQAYRLHQCSRQAGIQLQCSSVTAMMQNGCCLSLLAHDRRSRQALKLSMQSEYGVPGKCLRGHICVTPGQTQGCPAAS